jgi:hypothetical protein
MTDEIDQKLARLGARVQERAGGIRERLAAIGALELAEDCKKRFGARLAYLKTPCVERGNPVVNGDNLMRPGCVWTVYTKPKDRGTVTNERASTKGRTKSSTWGDIHGG